MALVIARLLNISSPLTLVSTGLQVIDAQHASHKRTAILWKMRDLQEPVLTLQVATLCYQAKETANKIWYYLHPNCMLASIH